MTDWYGVLGVSRADALKDPEIVKRHYKALALTLHPDKQGISGETGDDFKRLVRGYQILSNPSLRQVIDCFGDSDNPELVVEQAESMFPGMELAAALGLLKILTPDRRGIDVSALSEEELDSLTRKSPQCPDRVWLNIFLVATYLVIVFYFMW